MRKSFVLLLAIAMLSSMAMVVLAAEEKAKPAKAAMPGADGDKFVNYITKESPYTKWKLFPGTEKFYKGTEPHGALLTTYVNGIALKSIDKKAGMADGSIIVKENYTPDKKLVAVTSMYKIKGFNPDGGDWFWVKSSPEGKADASGKVEGCIKCHAKMMDNDYVFAGEVVKGKFQK